MQLIIVIDFAIVVVVVKYAMRLLNNNNNCKPRGGEGRIESKLEMKKLRQLLSIN